ncbi:hypothetical protein D9M71_750100 [compost metagenome]
MHYLAQRLGRRVGGSSGTNLIGALAAAQEMRAAGEAGSIVAILCDGGDRYATTYYDQDWLSGQGYQLEGMIAAVAACVERGEALPAITVLRYESGLQTEHAARHRFSNANPVNTRRQDPAGITCTFTRREQALEVQALHAGITGDAQRR